MTKKPQENVIFVRKHELICGSQKVPKWLLLGPIHIHYKKGPLMITVN